MDWSRKTRRRRASLSSSGGQNRAGAASNSSSLPRIDREAHKHCAQDPVITLQRAEALLLAQDAAGALPLWTSAHSPKSARHLAALVICEIVAGNTQRRFSAGDETLVSQELLKWYRLLLSAGANTLLGKLNESMEKLRDVTPSFVRAWETAATGARRVPVAA